MNEDLDDNHMNKDTDTLNMKAYLRHHIENAKNLQIDRVDKIDTIDSSF